MIETLKRWLLSWRALPPNISAEAGARLLPLMPAKAVSWFKRRWVRGFRPRFEDWYTLFDSYFNKLTDEIEWEQLSEEVRQKIGNGSGGGNVASVFGRQGAVEAAAGDYRGSLIALTDYQVGSSEAPIFTSDHVSSALGKLEYKVNRRIRMEDIRNLPAASMADINTLTTPGTYGLNALAPNNPFNADCFIQVYTEPVYGAVVQTATAFKGKAGIYMRRKDGTGGNFDGIGWNRVYTQHQAQSYRYASVSPFVINGWYLFLQLPDIEQNPCILQGTVQHVCGNLTGMNHFNIAVCGTPDFAHTVQLQNYRPAHMGNMRLYRDAANRIYVAADFAGVQTYGHFDVTSNREDVVTGWSNNLAGLTQIGNDFTPNNS